MSVGSVIDLAEEDGEDEDSRFNTFVGLTCSLGDMANDWRPGPMLKDVGVLQSRFECRLRTYLLLFQLSECKLRKLLVGNQASFRQLTLGVVVFCQAQVYANLLSC
jgi:hypothetical protein